MNPSSHSTHRPDLARSQTSGSRAPYPAYPQHDAYHSASYAPPHHPVYVRQHHSFYDERDPPPPYPLQYRRQDERYLHPHQHYSQRQHQQYAPNQSGSTMPQRQSLPVKLAQSLCTYRGHVKTTQDAILLLAACDLPNDAGGSGIAPPRRVTRRLLDSERAGVIASGSIFVWEEKEAGMRRWTDGKCWSASRVSGCFLTYRELEARKKPSSSITGGPTSNLYKADGLIKQSFSMTTTSGRKLHVISYYTKGDVRAGLLPRVSEDPRFVGEGGGEWNLVVDEGEYPDPISRAGDLAGEVEGEDSLSPPSSPLQPSVVRSSPKDSASEEQVNTSPSSEEQVDTPSSSEEDAVRLSTHRQIRNELWSKDRYEPRRILPSPNDDGHGQEHIDGGWRLNELSKRSFDEIDSVRPEEARFVRPKLQRMRSSSMNSVATDQHQLAPISSFSRTGSSDDGMSRMRSTHVGPAGFHERDSAVGALLSLRSSTGSSTTTAEESCRSNPSMSSIFTRSPSASTASSAESDLTLAKPSFSRTDRAALDRFSIRV